MTPAEINREIAGLCGWTMALNPSYRGWRNAGFKHRFESVPVWTDIPNYHASLDACAQFEATLKFTSTMGEYLEILTTTANELGVCWTTRTFHAVCATAPQRCEAFLRLHGKWRGE